MYIFLLFGDAFQEFLFYPNIILICFKVSASPSVLCSSFSSNEHSLLEIFWFGFSLSRQNGILLCSISSCWSSSKQLTFSWTSEFSEESLSRRLNRLLLFKFFEKESKWSLWYSSCTKASRISWDFESDWNSLNSSTNSFLPVDWLSKLPVNPFEPIKFQFWLLIGKIS